MPDSFTISSNKFNHIQVRKQKLMDMPNAWKYEAFEPSCKLIWMTNLYDHYHFWQADFEITTPQTITFATKRPYLGFILIVRTNLKYHIAGLNEIEAASSQVDLIAVPNLSIEYQFLKASYAIIGINIYHSFFEGWNIHFQSSQHLTNALATKTPWRPKNVPMNISTRIASTITAICNCEYTAHYRKKYIGIKTHELIFLILHITSKYDRPLQIHESDLLILKEVHVHMMTNLPNPGTISQLAHEFGINASKLKKGFKQVFGTSIHAFLLEERMQLALDLLTNSKEPVTEIAHLCGYNNVSAFSAAFKKRFGMPPSKLRQ